MGVGRLANMFGARRSLFFPGFCILIIWCSVRLVRLWSERVCKPLLCIELGWVRALEE